MAVNESFYPQQIGKSARASASGQEYRTKIAAEAINAGQAVQLTAADANQVEVHDGSQPVYGVAAYSSQADQDFRRDDDARDRAQYVPGSPVAVQRPGGKNDIIVEFAEAAATLGEGVAVDEETGNFRPASTENATVTQLEHAEITSTTIENDGVLIGAIRLRPVESA